MNEPAETGSGTVLVGEELARRLGLTPMTDNVVTGCAYFAEAAEGRGLADRFPLMG